MDRATTTILVSIVKLSLSRIAVVISTKLNRMKAAITHEMTWLRLGGYEKPFFLTFL